MDTQDQELNSLEEAIEKVINAKIKPLLEPPSGTQKMDSKYPQGNRSMKKEEKDFGKIESTDTFFANISGCKHQQFSTYQSQTGKKN